jgi:hypothetical protein
MAQEGIHILSGASVHHYDGGEGVAKRTQYAQALTTTERHGTVTESLGIDQNGTYTIVTRND